MKKHINFSAITKSITSGDITCKALVKEYLDKIEQSNTNAFIEVFTESALAKAKEVDEKVTKKTAGKLAGMIIGIKDNICYKDHPLSASSDILKNFESVYSSTVIDRLIKEDAIIIGRLNCDEFAMGSSNENTIYGSVMNPHDLTKVAGGSSGGSAAALAEGLCIASLGSDTGGSIRQPASFCGVLGLKPTYGRVSRYGLIAYGSSFDQIGPFTNNVEDAALILGVISGADEYDSTSSSKPVPDYINHLDLKEKKIKIAIPNEYINAIGLDKEIKESLLNTIALLKKDGHTVQNIDFPFLKYLIPIYYILSTAEASSNLARYDGAHYGNRSSKSTDIESTYINSRSEGFGLEVKRRIMLGNFILSAGYYDAYYTKALKARRIIKEKSKQIFQDFDMMMMPTTPSTAFDLEGIKDPIEMYLQDIFTVHANLAGMPAISIPLGIHSNKMPFGIQLMTDEFEEEKLLAFANYLMSN